MSGSSSEDVVNNDQLSDRDASEDGMGGLFGSESEDGQTDGYHAKKKRRLDDPDLDSGDDEGRADRAPYSAAEGDDDEEEERMAIVTEMAIGKHPGPLPSDGELYLLQFPSTIGINPKAFTLEGFAPPTMDHHSVSTASSTFSAFALSNNTIRWRKSKDSPKILESNSRINRWSDGSLTLQIGSNSREQFELTAKALAEPQIKPVIPTPTSRNLKNHDLLSYNPRADLQTYLASPHEHAGLMRNTQHVTMSLGLQSAEQDDDALLRLQQGLAAAVRGNKTTADGGVEVINISEDPENAKRRAELAEKEKVRMLRRYQNQQDRETNRTNNHLKRAGLRPGVMSTGLTIGGLEGDDELAGATRKAKSKPKKTRRHNDEYSDEDDFRGRRRTREDEYDEDDGFLVGSDEEVEEELEDEESAEEASDLDAEGEDDEEVMNEKPPVTSKPAGSLAEADDTGGARQKRRRVIEDEDEDEG